MYQRFIVTGFEDRGLKTELKYTLYQGQSALLAVHAARQFCRQGGERFADVVFRHLPDWSEVFMEDDILAVYRQTPTETFHETDIYEYYDDCTLLVRNWRFFVDHSDGDLIINEKGELQFENEYDDVCFAVYLSDMDD